MTGRKVTFPLLETSLHESREGFFFIPLQRMKLYFFSFVFMNVMFEVEPYGDEILNPRGIGNHQTEWMEGECHEGGTDGKEINMRAARAFQGHGLLEHVEDSRIRSLVLSSLKELENCRLCPWECGVNRLAGAVGKCGASAFGEVFYAGLLLNEERALNPAYEVFFTGCNLSCRFCYLADKVCSRNSGKENRKDQSRPLEGHPLFLDPGLSAARSLCAVGGEPATNLPAALALFGAINVRPRVWNSNMYYGSFVADAAADAADVVVADVHFGNDDCAGWISGVKNYMETVTRNIERAVDAGLRVIVRHLLLPGHLKCCGFPAVRLMAERFPYLRFHILDNYVPPPKSRTSYCRELRQRRDPLDVKKLVEAARDAGLDLEAPYQKNETIKERGMASDSIRAWLGETGELIIDEAGRVIIPHLTPGLLQMFEEIRGMEDVQKRGA